MKVAAAIGALVTALSGQVSGEGLYFIDATDAAGIALVNTSGSSQRYIVEGMMGGSAFFDYDNDGDLDVYLMNHSIHTPRSYGNSSQRATKDSLSGDRLYENKLDEGLTRFVDVTDQSGIFSSALGYGLALITSDINLDGLDILLLPWISVDNHDETLEVIQNSKAKIAMGHLEINGFKATRGHMMEDGMPKQVFDKFDNVFSGHFHTRSSDGKIHYLGNPYEMFWNDVNDPRGFTLFDTDTLERVPVNNPYKLFYNVYYEDTNHKLFNTTQYHNKIVKVIVRKKSNPKEFQKFIDKLYRSGVHDLKIVENFAIAENKDFDIEEDENTISILNRYIDESEIEFDKGIVKNIFRDLYRQACEVE